MLIFATIFVLFCKNIRPCFSLLCLLIAIALPLLDTRTKATIPLCVRMRHSAIDVTLLSVLFTFE